ncbi:hypothetical protein AAMO2058_001575200 [Amorphochlora amoebiformis]
MNSTFDNIRNRFGHVSCHQDWISGLNPIRQSEYRGGFCSPKNSSGRMASDETTSIVSGSREYHSQQEKNRRINTLSKSAENSEEALRHEAPYELYMFMCCYPIIAPIRRGELRRRAATVTKETVHAFSHEAATVTKETSMAGDRQARSLHQPAPDPPTGQGWDTISFVENIRYVDIRLKDTCLGLQTPAMKRPALGLLICLAMWTIRENVGSGWIWGGDTIKSDGVWRVRVPTTRGLRPRNWVYRLRGGVTKLEGANEGCEGPEGPEAGRRSSCEGCPNQSKCSSGEGAAGSPDPLLEERLAAISKKILVLSGKGGVGKSTISVFLAHTLANMGYKVGLLDIDICGPSIPKMVGLEGSRVAMSNLGWEPVPVPNNSNLSVMSVGFLLNNPDDAVVWRGPRKDSLIRQFLRDVNWGTLDYLIVDTPPGTSDEHISVAQALATAKDVALADVRKEITFCRKVGIAVLGVIENMKGLKAPLTNLELGQPHATVRDMDTGEDVTKAALEALSSILPGKRLSVHVDILPQTAGGAEQMAKDMCIDYLGSVSMEPYIAAACDRGEWGLQGVSVDAKMSGECSDVVPSWYESRAGSDLRKIVDRIHRRLSNPP